jgi:hypothetical protein
MPLKPKSKRRPTKTKKMEENPQSPRKRKERPKGPSRVRRQTTNVKKRIDSLPSVHDPVKLRDERTLSLLASVWRKNNG